MKSVYFGPEADESELERALDRLELKHEHLSEQESIDRAADLLAGGAVLGWFQGRTEFGPRALGNRSILAHPGLPGTSDAVNERIKFRETWRPFCPSVLAEDAAEILGSEHAAPFMTLSFSVNEAWRERIREVVHVDGSARAQTVTAEDQPRFHQLISAFKARTGLPVLLNTSLNRRGEPMASSVEDALATFLGSGLEHLFIGTTHVSKALCAAAASDMSSVGAGLGEH